MSPMSPRQRELLAGVGRGALIGALVLAVGLPLMRLARTPSSGAPGTAVVQAAPVPAGVALAVARTAPADPAAAPRFADFGDERPPADVRRIADWATDSGDSRGLHFVVLDKRRAQVYVFEPDGRLAGTSPVLLGSAPGDDTVAGVGGKPISEVKPEERTTPAGRFVAEPGRNALGEDVVWVDYEAAVSMHRVRLTDPRERRAQRLASPTPDDNRISYGCINMPVAFFEQTLAPAFAGRYGIVYVLPETRPLEAVFAAAYDPADAVARRGRPIVTTSAG